MTNAHSHSSDAPSRGMNRRVIAALFLVHFSGDFYQSFFNPLYPVIKQQFGLSLTQVGLITSVVALSSFIAQPVTGYLTDKGRPKSFILVGLALSFLCIPMMGATPWYGLLVLFAGLGAFGSSLYHPASAGYVSVYAGERTGLGMSIFGLGGTLAFTVGPMALAGYVTVFGIHTLPMTSLLGLLLVCLLFFLLPTFDKDMEARQSRTNGSGNGLKQVWKTLALLWLICVMRALVDTSLKTFYPIFYMEQGNSLVSTGAVLSAYMLGGSVSAVVWGYLADTRGYKTVFLASFVLAAPCVLWFLQSQGWLLYPAAFLAGFLLLATMFPAVALAAKYAPKNRTLASSLVFGFSTGTAGLLAPVIGDLAERFGLHTVLLAIGVLPIFCFLLAIFLPRDKVKQ